MIRRSPAEYYIKYLLVHPDRYEDSEIEDTLHRLQLDNIGEDYVEKLRFSCLPPTPFYPFDETHFLSQRFLYRQDIRSLFFPDADTRLAQRALQTPRAKELIETSLICQSAPLWIAAALKKKEGFPATEASIRVYQHFFFNIRLVDTHELKTLLRKRVELVEVPDPEQQALNQISWKVGYTDPRRVSAEMAITPLAGMLHELRLGVLPSNVELKKVATAARLAATVGCLEGLMKGDRPDRCRDLAQTAKLMHEMLETIGDPESELQASLSALTLKTEAAPIPPIHQLTAGNHTTDVQPIEEKKEDG